MVEYKYAELFQQDSVDKQWKIEYDGGVIVNDGQLFSQSIEISESLCSEKELRFGSCEASSLKFKTANVVRPLMNEWLTVSVVLDGRGDEPFMIGKYKVVSDKPTADRRHREIVAYDAMYDILNADMAEWYNSVLPEKTSSVTLKEFRESFVRYFGLAEVLPKGGLVNDDMVVEKTIEITTDSSVDSDAEQTSVIAGGALSGRDVITAVCEINGCFGHIGRDGKFHYIYLPQSIQGLYPADNLYPADDLFPAEPGTTRIGGGTYISCQYDDYVTGTISRIQIRQEENDIGLIYGSGDNDYIIEGNFLVYGKSSGQLGVIAANIYRKITAVTYQPFSCEAMGNPCFEVGDPVRLPTRYELIETYILERTLKGIQALRDTYKSQGAERYEESVNGVHQSILQLKGKSNVLTRTIEETRSELKDTEKGLVSTISQTAATIRLEVSQTYETKEYAYSQYGKLTERIELADGKIELEIKRAEASEERLNGVITDTERELISKIELTERNITLSLSEQIEETKEYASSAADAVSKETGERLKEYYTKTETESAIEIEKNRIDLSVSEKITETRKYAETKASEAEKAAGYATDEKLKSYSTTTEMNAAIELEKNRIDLSVSEKITETKTYAETKASEAEKSAKGDTAEKLKSYSTTTQMNAAIKLSSDGIKQTVSETYETKTDAGAQYKSFRSAIEQNARDIELKVDSDGVIAAINLSSEAAVIKADKIKLEGTVTANSRFIINTDGSMKCDKATITNTTCTNLDVQNGMIGGFTLTQTRLGDNTSNGYTRMNVAGEGEAFGAGSSSAHYISIKHSGEIFTTDDIRSESSVSARTEIKLCSSNGIDYVKTHRSSGRGVTDWYASSGTTSGHVMAFDDALEILATNNLALHSGSSYAIQLYSNTKYWGSFEAASSRKYKKNIAEIPPEEADKISELVPVEFDYNYNDNHSAGFIAEDVYSLLPQVVGLKDGEPDSIDYIKLIPFIVRKMKNIEERMKKYEQS